MQKFHTILTDRLEGLRNATGESLKLRGPEFFSDQNDQASRESERALDLGIAERNRGQAKQIELALRKIEKGEYGICESCEEEIDSRRLVVNPEAIYCTDCQSRIESQSKVYSLAS